ncbi:ABC transporter ATP-binding protein [Agromyces endophyticus]|uniref:ABC transporter ATP-binding protein n=1 Tax=Agromyces sp. H17E-10 TaxID=2932244 RepID=UPI001FD0C4B8|nr:ABC transporter ATP-binding protein [Agromyces sp. H17E-10]UOQ87798.1 ABC transporter ATP-binding protein [Agromyces sp. H17E-10]
MSSFVLEASGLVKTYGQTRALAGVDLRVRTGESLAIMGASGSGKTTLLHCLAGIVPPDSGAVSFLSGAGRVDVTALGERERSRLRREAFGFVFQQGLLIPELTAVENVSLALMLNGMPRARAEEYGRGWLAALGLAGMEDRRIGQLSGGQAQRVAIARAQVTGAPVVFADEPTGALDSATSADVMQALLDSTTGQGRTLVLVTHDADVAGRCSRIVDMRDGRIVGERVPAGAAAAQAASTGADAAAGAASGVPA